MTCRELADRLMKTPDAIVFGSLYGTDTEILDFVRRTPMGGLDRGVGTSMTFAGVAASPVHRNAIYLQLNPKEPTQT